MPEMETGLGEPSIVVVASTQTYFRIGAHSRPYSSPMMVDAVSGKVAAADSVLRPLAAACSAAGHGGRKKLRAAFVLDLRSAVRKKRQMVSPENRAALVNKAKRVESPSARRPAPPRSSAPNPRPLAKTGGAGKTLRQSD